MQQQAEVPVSTHSIEEAPAHKLKFVFSLLHPGYLRHFGQPIRLLAERGHEVHVALGRLEKDPGDFKLIEQLAAENPNVTYSHAPARRRRDGWRRIGWLVRALTDLSRDGDPRYADAPALRGRFVDKLDWRIDYSRLPKTLKGPLHQRVASLATGADAELSREDDRAALALRGRDPAEPPDHRVPRRREARRRACEPRDRVRLVADRVPEGGEGARDPHGHLRRELWGTT